MIKREIFIAVSFLLFGFFASRLSFAVGKTLEKSTKCGYVHGKDTVDFKINR